VKASAEVGLPAVGLVFALLNAHLFWQAGRYSDLRFWIHMICAVVFFAGMFLRRSFRVFVTMDAGRFEIARILGNDFPNSKVRVKDARARAEALVAEIQMKIADAAVP